MVEITKGKAIGIYAIEYTNKLTKKLTECEFNIKKSIPGLYPTMREIIACFLEFGIELHNYTDEQDRRFQKALIMLTKEFTEFLGTLHEVHGADKKELLVMLSIDVYKTEIERADNLSDEEKDILTSEFLIGIFEEIVSKSIISVLMFKDIVNAELSAKDFRSCMARWCCCACRRKKKKYLK
jgi:hypothetical protein